MAKPSRALYFSPPSHAVKDLGRCPLKVAYVNQREVGFFPLRAIQCKSKTVESHRKWPLYENCRFYWEEEPITVTDRFSARDWSGDYLTDDPMKWMRGAAPRFIWDCPDRIFVGGDV